MGGTEAKANPMRDFFAGRRVAVTGGAGFIGGHLCEALLLLGAQVNVIDDLSNADGFHVSALAESYPKQLRFIYGSILEPGALAETLEGARIIFHLAAMNSVPRSIDEPERAFEVNAIGTVRVAEMARRVGADRLVYAASSSAYGDEPTQPKRETMLPQPISPYAASKLAGESVVRAWSHSYGLSGISLRLFNVFGPRQPAGDAYAAVVGAFITKLLAGERPMIFGDGSQTRDFTPVANVVQAMLAAAALKDDPAGRVVNVALGRSTSVLELLHKLAALTGKEGVEPIFEPARRGDVPHSTAEISLAKAILGFEPMKALDEGLADTVAWYSRSKDPAGQPVAGGVLGG